MTDSAMIAARHNLALKEVADILTKHDPEVGERIKKANHGRSVPSPSKAPLETAAAHAECMASLARLAAHGATSLWSLRRILAGSGAGGVGPRTAKRGLRRYFFLRLPPFCAI